MPVIGCQSSAVTAEVSERIDCGRPTEVLDALQRQVEAMATLRESSDAEYRCGQHYRQALEWIAVDRERLVRSASAMLADCNRVFSKR
jgi:hypothetical protein